MLPAVVLDDLVPFLSVDPQTPRERQAGLDAGDPAAQRAGDGVDGSLQGGHLLQARGAEGVLAVEHSGDPAGARVLVVANDAFKVLAGHGDFRRQEGKRAAKKVEEKKR